MHGDCLTVTGRTMAENLEALAPAGLDGEVLRSLDRPIHATGGLTILKGSLAPEGAVVKSAGFDDSAFTGTARVFDGERAAMDALEAGQITAGDVVVIRYEGPKGGPGMREMLAITGAIKGAGLGKDVLLITDGRFSGGTTGLCVGPHRPRGRRRRPDRVRARRRPDHPRRAPAARSTSRSRSRSSPPARTAGRPTPRSTPRACWASTPSSSRSAAHGAVMRLTARQLAHVTASSTKWLTTLVGPCHAPRIQPIS